MLDKSKTCWIVRGLPGSGKTTVAKKLAKSMEAEYISLDTYRVDDEGNYRFDPRNITKEVDAQYEAFKAATFVGGGDVIVDNTHSREWEYRGLVELAVSRGYVVHVIEVQSNFLDCWERQTHGVPWDKFKEMAERWESKRIPNLNDLMKIIVDLRRRVR